MMKNTIQLTGLLVLLISLSFSLAQITEDPTVDAGDLGTIIGSNFNTTYPELVPHFRFAGIPYATHERFMPSRLKEGPLNGTDPFYAKTFGLNCYQPSLLPNPQQSEDCLLINIWTRKVNKEGEEPEVKRPVILFVHGGAFTIGNGAFFPGSTLLNRDVVFVNFHYRLGVLGFFCLDNEDAPGNAGMYDVVTAMQWVQKYIHHFGGDPEKVTLAGQSAGSVAVTLMMVSPPAQGLFHRAIASSGSVLNAWGSTFDAKSGSVQIANACGCIGSDAEIVACMKDPDRTEPQCLVDKLAEYQTAERLEGRLGTNPVTPVIQRDFNIGTHPKLLVEEPIKTFTEGRQANVPLIMGTTRHDGSFVMGMNYQTFLQPNNLTDNTSFMKNQFVPMILQAVGIHDNSFGIYETLAKTYIGDARLTGDFNLMLPGLIDLQNVFFYKAGAYRLAQLHSKISDTFWYSFDFKGSQSLWAFLFNFQPPYFPGGVAHTDDLIYLFPLAIVGYNPREKLVSERMLDYWFNLAEFGNPTPAENGDLTIWPTLNEDESKYLSINNDSTVMENYPDAWVDASIELFPELLPVITTEAELPTTTEADLPTTTEADLPTTTEADLPTTTEADLPTTTEADVPTTTEEPTTTPSAANTKLFTPLCIIISISVVISQLL